MNKFFTWIRQEAEKSSAYKNERTKFSFDCATMFRLMTTLLLLISLLQENQIKSTLFLHLSLLRSLYFISRSPHYQEFIFDRRLFHFIDDVDGQGQVVVVVIRNAIYACHLTRMHT